jgi:hypothetical protein
LIDRDPLALGEFRADHLHRDLRDFYLVHLAVKMNHHAPVNLHDVDLNSVLKVLMKVYPNQDVQGVRNYLVYLNYRDALPYAYSLISIEIQIV